LSLSSIGEFFHTIFLFKLLVPKAHAPAGRKSYVLSGRDVVDDREKRMGRVLRCSCTDL
jgi:hypothetical protein